MSSFTFSQIKGVICWNITDSGNGAGVWTVDLKNGSGSVSEGKGTKANLTLTISDDNMVKMAEGKLNAQSAFMSGKIKIKGNMGLAMKLNSVMDAVKKHAGAAAAAPSGGAGGPKAGKFIGMF